MSDILRTALKGGGRLLVLIDRWPNGDFHLEVTEDWERMTRVMRGIVTAEQMDAAADPDGLIKESAAKLMAAVHINHEVGEKGGADR